MRRICIFAVILTLLGLGSVALVHAHIGGLPFFKTNGTYSTGYNIPSVSIPDLVVPQDSAVGTYLINQPIAFEIDTKVLQIPDTVVSQTRFDWDFGDGTKGTGQKNTHTYNKSGSYIISINALGKDNPTNAQLIESLVVNILPRPDYQLPKAVMKINGQVVTDPTTDVINFDVNQDVTFDATASTASSSSIMSYQWNFSDNTAVATGPTVTHRYTADHRFAAPFLRVTDANRLFNDTYVELQDIQGGQVRSARTTASPFPTVTVTPVAQSNKNVSEPAPWYMPLLTIAAVPVFIIVVAIIIVVLRNRRS